MTSTPDSAVPRLVVVDDTDPLIQYSPSGAFTLDSEGKLDGQGYGGPVFNHTLTGTTTNGSFTYNFNGTFVRAMVAAEGLYGWNCSVDGHVIASFFVDPPQVTNYLACDSAGLLAGSTSEHTLGVNFYFFDTSSSNSSLWLDSIQYQPLPADPLDAVTLRIHNSDPSITYSNTSGAWFEEFDSNATVTAGTSMNIVFNGTSASLFSVNAGKPFVKNASAAFYSVDGKSTNFDLPASVVTPSTGNFSNIFNWPLFTTSNLPASQHNMQVATSSKGNSDPQNLVIDYFIIRTNPTGMSHSNATHVGAIAGGIVGGVVGVVVLCVALYFLCIRRRSRYHSDGGSDLMTITQYPSTFSPNAPYPRQSKNAQTLQVEDDEVRLHADSGIRIPTSGVREVRDVPPTYTEY